MMVTVWGSNAESQSPLGQTEWAGCRPAPALLRQRCASMCGAVLAYNLAHAITGMLQPCSELATCSWTHPGSSKRLKGQPHRQHTCSTLL